MLPPLQSSADGGQSAPAFLAEAEAAGIDGVLVGDHMSFLIDEVKRLLASS
jgi:hypothetical protein